MYTLQQFGQQVKTKYPQYANIDDTELANKMLEKYPQYQKQITGFTPQQTNTVPEKEETPTNLITGAFKVVPKVVDVAEKAIKFTGIPWLAGKATQTLGGAVGGLTGGLAETAKQTYRAATGKGFDVGQIGKSAVESAKDTAEFGKFVGEEGTTAAPFAGLGKIPSAAIAAPTLVEGVKEGDLTKIAIGGLGAVGAKFSKGNWIDRAMFSSGIKTATKEAGEIGAKETKVLDNATSEMRTILRPTQGEVKNIEIRQNKNIDDYYKLAAEEKLPIKETPDKKLDTVEARDILKPKQQEIHNILNAQLDTNPSQQFDLLKLGEEAKNELSKTIKNATDLKSAIKDVDEYIADAIDFQGRYLSGRQLNEFKSGMWSAGYNMMKPTAQSTARKLGHLAKEMIETSYDDLTIKELNELSGRYATLSHLLENAQGRVIQGGALGRVSSQVLGAVAGSKIPVVGPIAGQWLGGKVSEAIYSPARKSAKIAKQVEKTGTAGKTFKETTQKGVKALVEQKPKYPALPPPRINTPTGNINLPARTQ